MYQELQNGVQSNLIHLENLIIFDQDSILMVIWLP